MKLRYYPTVSHHEGGAIYSLDFHPSGEKLITCGQRGRKGDGTVMVWSLKNLYSNCKKIVLSEMIHQKILNCVRWSKIDNGRHFACGGDDSEVFVYQYVGRGKNGGSVGATSLLCDVVERYKNVHRLLGHVLDVLHLEWSHDGRFLASSSVDGAVIIWDVANGFNKLVVLNDQRGGHTESVKGISFDPVGRFFMTQSADKTMKVWTTDEWQCVSVITEPFEGSGTSTMFLRHDWSPDGAYVVAPGATNNGGPTAQIIQRNGWTTQRDLVGHRKPVTCVRSCPKLLKYTDYKGNLRTVSCFAVGSSDKSLSIWSIPSLYRPIVVLTNLFKHSIVDLTWCGTQLAACSMDGTVRLFDFKAKELGHLLSTADMAKEFDRVYKTVPRHCILSDVSNGTVDIRDKYDPYGSTDPASALLARRRDKKLMESLLMIPENSTEKTEKAAALVPPAGRATTQQNLRTKSGKKKIMPIFLGSFTDNGLEPANSPMAPSEPTGSSKKLANEEGPVSQVTSIKKRKIMEYEQEEDRPLKKTKQQEQDVVEISKFAMASVSDMLKAAEKLRVPPIQDTSVKELRSIPTSADVDVRAPSPKFEIPKLKVQMSAKVYSADPHSRVSTINVENKFNVSRDTNDKRTTVRITALDQSKKQVWSASMITGGLVSLVEASDRFTIVATSESLVRIMSTSTGRWLREWSVDGVVVMIRINRNFLLVVSACGTLRLWNLTCPDNTMKATLMINQSLTDILLKDVNVTNVRLLRNGCPVVELSSGKSFTFSTEEGVWSLLMDNQSVVSALSLPVIPPTPFGGILHELAKKSSDRLVEASDEIVVQATEDQLERAILAAQSLRSVKEYCFLAERYVRILVAYGKTEKSLEFLRTIRNNRFLGKRAEPLYNTLISILEQSSEFDSVRRSLAGTYGSCSHIIWS
uniref:Protein HIRA n=1 Tax=Steinernema glaseri TaxID=37863 RepID=A0A1I8AMC2_9BILA